MLGPFCIPHTGGPQAPSYKLRTKKQALHKEGGLSSRTKWFKLITPSLSEHQVGPGKPRVVIPCFNGIYRFPSILINDTRPFYRGEPRTNRDSYVAISKMLVPWFVIFPYVWSLRRLVMDSANWEQAIQLR